MENTDDESSSGGSIVSGWTSMYTEDNCVDIGSSNEDESDFEPYSSNGKNNMEDNYSDNNDDDDCDSVASGKTDCSIPAAPKKQKKKVASAASSSSKKYANILQEETDFIPE